MLVPIYNIRGEVVGERDLPESIFGIEPNEDLMHQALMRQLANARLGTHDTKTRGEVSGGGRKPWRQKGTGRARQGSTRSPIWRGGGIVFGPTPRSYSLDMPKKMRRAAVRSALSVKARGGLVTLVDDLDLGGRRTKDMMQLLANLQVGEDVLIALDQRNENVEIASRNLPRVKVIQAGYLNVRDLLGYERLLLPVSSLDIIEAWLQAESTAPAEVSV
ncbi:MAG: 50S ribosomal protein L4 [Anaerolineae bacterium]